MKILNRKKDIRLAQDEFTQRILCTVPGMLEPGNLESFDYVAKHLTGNNPCLEIGSFCGLSSILLRYFLDNHNKSNKIFSCDNWSYEGFYDNTPDRFVNKDFKIYNQLVGDNKNINRDNYKRFVKNQFKSNTQFFSSHNMPASYHLASDVFFSLWDESSAQRDIFGNENRLGGKISFAFIDGGHSYAQSKKDFLNCDNHLENNGFLLLDDSADGGIFGSAKVAKEIKSLKEYKTIHKKPNYLFQKI